MKTIFVQLANNVRYFGVETDENNKTCNIIILKITQNTLFMFRSTQIQKTILLYTKPVK